MAQQMIRGGTPVDIPSTAEIGAEVDQRWRQFYDRQQAIADARERERARTIKPVRASGPSAAKAASFFIPGPDSGYMWNVKLISVQLDSADTVQAFIATAAPGTGATPRSLISKFGASDTTQVVTFSSDQILLNPDEGLWLTAAAHSITAYFVTAIEVMAERIAEVL
jgi:hypothetical protein